MLPDSWVPHKALKAESDFELKYHRKLNESWVWLPQNGNVGQGRRSKVKVKYQKSSFDTTITLL